MVTWRRVALIHSGWEIVCEGRVHTQGKMSVKTEAETAAAAGGPRNSRKAQRPGQTASAKPAEMAQP